MSDYSHLTDRSLKDSGSDSDYHERLRVAKLFKKIYVEALIAEDDIINGHYPQWVVDDSMSLPEAYDEAMAALVAISEPWT